MNRNKIAKGLNNKKPEKRKEKELERGGKFTHEEILTEACFLKKRRRWATAGVGVDSDKERGGSGGE